MPCFCWNLFNPNSLEMEDKSLLTASSNVEVSNHIPDDIVFSILSKLSLKSLKRFECVRKSWSLLFDNPYFMTMYRNHLLTKCCSYYDDDHTSVILDIIEVAEDEDEQLWNGFGDKFKLIPSHENSPLWNFSAHHFQIGYDRLKDDYKITRCTHYYPKDVPSCGMPSRHFWEIYSLSSNSWKKIDVEMPHFCLSREQVCMDGVFHWWDKNETHTCLVSFDFCKESSIITPIPVDDNFDSNLVRRHLMVLNGSIALMLNYTESSTFHISILGEIGVKESWTKLFIIGPLPACLEYPIGAGKKGNILFQKKDGELAWFDLSTGMIVEIGVTTYASDYRILFCNESLPIRGIYTNFSSCFHPRDL